MAACLSEAEAIQSFVPTEKELIDLLLDKVCGVQPISLSSDLDLLIPTADLYGEKEPWEIFSGSKQQKLFFFTKLKKSGNKKTSQRFLRKVGKGTWTNKGQKKYVYRNPGKIIGYKRCYRYQRKNDDDVADRHGIWLLQEYILPEAVIKDDRVKQENKDYVLCALKRKMTKKMMIKEGILSSTTVQRLGGSAKTTTTTTLDDVSGSAKTTTTTQPPSDDYAANNKCWNFLDFDELMTLPLPGDHLFPSATERCADVLMMDFFDYDSFRVSTV